MLDCESINEIVILGVGDSVREKTTLFVTFTDPVCKELTDTIADNVIVYIFVFEVKGEVDIDLL